MAIKPAGVNVLYKKRSEDIISFKLGVILENPDTDQNSGLAGVQNIGKMPLVTSNSAVKMDYAYQAFSQSKKMRKLEWLHTRLSKTITEVGGIDNSQTTITLDSITNLSNGDHLLAENEIFEITDASVNPISVLRGQHGTSAVAHTQNTKVIKLLLSVPFNTITLNGSVTALPVPTNVIATPGFGSITISWDALTGSNLKLLKHFKVFRNTVDNSSTATNIANVDSNKFVDSIPAVSIPTTFFYWVSSLNNSGVESAKSTPTASAKALDPVVDAPDTDTDVPSWISGQVPLSVNVSTDGDLFKYAFTIEKPKINPNNIWGYSIQGNQGNITFPAPTVIKSGVATITKGLHVVDKTSGVAFDANDVGNVIVFSVGGIEKFIGLIDAFNSATQLSAGPWSQASGSYAYEIQTPPWDSSKYEYHEMVVLSDKDTGRILFHITSIANKQMSFRIRFFNRFGFSPWRSTNDTVDTGTALSVAGDSIVPPPTGLAFNWRGKDQITASWAVEDPTIDGNRNIKRYQVELSSNTSFIGGILMSKDVGKVYIKDISLLSTVMADDFQRADGGIDEWPEVIASGTATGGSSTTLVDTTKDFVALGIVAGHLVKNTTRNNSIALVTSVATTTITFADGLSGIDTADETFTSGDAYKVIRGNWEGTLRDYEGDSGKFLTWSRQGFNISNFSVIGTLNGGTAAGVSLALWAEEAPDDEYTIETEVQCNNPFNTGHIAPLLRARADNSVGVGGSYYYAFVIDWGNGGHVHRDGAWLEKQWFVPAPGNNHISTEINGNNNHSHLDDTTITGAVTAGATSIPVADTSIFKQSYSAVATSPTYNGLVVSATAWDLSKVEAGHVVTTGSGAKGVVNTFDDTTNKITVFKWYGGTPSGTASVGWDEYAILMSADNSKSEVVKVTGVSGSNILVTRAQKGTTALTFANNDSAHVRFTPKYNTPYRVSATIVNSTSGINAVELVIRVDGLKFADYIDIPQASSHVSTGAAFSTPTGYPTNAKITATSWDLSDVAVGNWAIAANGAYAFITKFDDPSNVVYVNAWNTTPSGEVTIFNPAFAWKGQTGFGVLNNVPSGQWDGQDLQINNFFTQFPSFRRSIIYGRVRAYNDKGYGSWSTVQPFARNNPGPIELNTFSIGGNHIIFFVEPLLPDINFYLFEAWDAATGGNKIYSFTSSPGKNYIIFPAQTKETLYWQMAVFDKHGPGPFSIKRAKTTLPSNEIKATIGPTNIIHGTSSSGLTGQTSVADDIEQIKDSSGTLLIRVDKKGNFLGVDTNDAGYAFFRDEVTPDIRGTFGSLTD
ncbi:MAG: hypothetical protein ACE5HI_00605, partial [bacterium]